MRASITLYRYLASQVPNEAVELLADEGYRVRGRSIETEEDLASLLAQYVNDRGEAALEKLSQIHPDREMLQREVVPQRDPHLQPPVMGPLPYMNACGCGHMSATGTCGCGSCKQASFAGPGDENAKTLRLIVAGGLIVGGLAIVLHFAKLKII